jgi:hypothetical protein
MFLSPTSRARSATAAAYCQTTPLEKDTRFPPELDPATMIFLSFPPSKVEEFWTACN